MGYLDVSPGVRMRHMEGPKNPDGQNLGIHIFVCVYKVHMCIYILKGGMRSWTNCFFLLRCLFFLRKVEDMTVTTISKPQSLTSVRTHFGENKRVQLESSKQNYYIISFWAILKAIFTSGACGLAKRASLRPFGSHMCCSHRHQPPIAQLYPHRTHDGLTFRTWYEILENTKMVAHTDPGDIIPGVTARSIIYVPLQVIRFHKSILLIVQYEYLKSCSED